MTKTILNPTDAAALDAAGGDYMCRTNNGTWRGKPAKSWLCLNAGIIFEPWSGQSIARLEFVYRPELWVSWARYRNDVLGVPAACFRKNAGGYGPNGFFPANPYKQADFDALLALVP